MSCKQCGECCKWGGYVHLTDSDMKRISSFLLLDERDFTDKYTCLTDNRCGLSLTENSDGTCVFLTDDKCTIYPVRPKQCRDFPYSWTVKDMDRCRFYE